MHKYLKTDFNYERFYFFMRYFLFQLSFNNLNEWFDEIDKHVSKDVIKILIGNKMDMETDKVVDYTAAEVSIIKCFI